MSESFLYYIWQYQFFNKVDLQTTEGQPLSVFAPGHRNFHAGPDFQNARIRIHDVEWIGTVEIHIHASEWFQHNHQSDDAYENVVLHVVWENDKTIFRRDGTPLPALELKNKIDTQLLLNVKQLINSPHEIPCSESFHSVNHLTLVSMLDKALLSRLEHRCSEVLHLLAKNNNDWEETCFQWLAKNFGFKVNAQPFFQLAKMVPYKRIMKHAGKRVQVEAMLFGVGGFLNDELDELYYKELQREYNMLRQKFNFTSLELNKATWKFLRLRPANFPTLRIAQFAAILFEQRNIFSKIIETESIVDLRKLFEFEQSEYWYKHYHFGKIANDEVASLGGASIDNLLINTVVPLRVAFGKRNDDAAGIDNAIDILQKIGGERNSITQRWINLGMECRTAFDSQAMLELFNNFCYKRRCLDCTIGDALLKPSRQ